MKIPEYVSKNEVKQVCKELGFRDWSRLKTFKVIAVEAARILEIVNTKKMDVPLEDFKNGLDVELEHGTMFDDANVTNNHPLLTGKIVLAHLKETMDYYKRLEIAELEGDLLQAVESRDPAKIKFKYNNLIEAQLSLYKTINSKLNQKTAKKAKI
jgi:hypothetical protein